MGLIYLGSVVYKGSTWAIGLAVVSIVPLLTVVLGNCPLYNLLGISKLRRIQTASSDWGKGNKE